MSIEDEVADFVVQNNLDVAAQNAMYELEPDLQRELMDRGSLTDARNPSAVVLSRVRNIKNASMKYGGITQTDMRDEIARFVEEYGLDDRAETVLKETEERVLRELFTRDRNLSDARNPSAVVLARIREIRKDMEVSGGGGGDFRGGGGGRGRDDNNPRGGRGNDKFARDDEEHEIFRFVKDNGLDERAEQCLKESEPWVLRELFDRGSLNDARNPSAVVLARLREIKKEGPSGRNDDDRGGRGGKGRGGKAEFMSWMNEMWDKWQSDGGNGGGGRRGGGDRGGDRRGGKGRAPGGGGGDGKGRPMEKRRGPY